MGEDLRLEGNEASDNFGGNEGGYLYSDKIKNILVKET